MRPILALNCLLQIEQERSEEESSVGDALALAFRCARFCSKNATANIQVQVLQSTALHDPLTSQRQE